MLNQNSLLLIAKDIIKTLTPALFNMNGLEINTLINKTKLNILVSDMSWAWWLLLLLIIPLAILIYRKRDSISRAYRMAIHKYRKKRK